MGWVSSRRCPIPKCVALCNPTRPHLRQGTGAMCVAAAAWGISTSYRTSLEYTSGNGERAAMMMDDDG